LEYLEVFGLPYELSGHVLGSRDVWAHTLYEISTIDPETQSRLPLAFGGRYDPIMSRFAKRSDSAAMIGINVEVRGGTRPKKLQRVSPGNLFAHLGMEARAARLSSWNRFARRKFPVHQSLTYDRSVSRWRQREGLAFPIY
jgi:hypothetical protein